MSDVAISDGGPAGLSAALFTAKNGLDRVVLDIDDTAVHAAYLLNDLGLKEMSGDVHGGRPRTGGRVERRPPLGGGGRRG